MLKLGIIGHPLHHTLSPLLHAELLKRTALAGEYKAYDLAPDALLCGLQDLQEAGVTGLNVTIPHKVSVMAHVTKLAAEAELCGAVNVLAMNEREIEGHNTDVGGFVQGLPAHFSDSLSERQVLVLGGGGAARAVLLGLMQMHAASITIAIRNPDKITHLMGDAERIKERTGARTEISVVSHASLPSLESFTGLINTMPVGMWPDVQFSPLPKTQLQTLGAGALVYDLIYRPLETQLIRDAKSLGYETLNGLPMLVYQGIAAFELWTGKSVDGDVALELQELLALQLETASTS